jgi:hypothetical protein
MVMGSLAGRNGRARKAAVVDHRIEMSLDLRQAGVLVVKLE